MLKLLFLKIVFGKQIMRFTNLPKHEHKERLQGGVDCTGEVAYFTKREQEYKLMK